VIFTCHIIAFEVIILFVKLNKKIYFFKTDYSLLFVFVCLAGDERRGRPVTENFESLLFAASTPYEVDEWIRAINRVIYTVCEFLIYFFIMCLRDNYSIKTNTFYREHLYGRVYKLE